MWRHLFLSGAVAAALAASACGDPCRTLSEKVCRCEQSPAARAACLARVAARAAQWERDPDPAAEQAGRERCAALLDGCTCAALAERNLAACGLASP